LNKKKKNSFQGLLSEKQFFNVMTCASKEITFFGAGSVLSGAASFLCNFYKAFCTPVKIIFGHSRWLQSYDVGIWLVAGT